MTKPKKRKIRGAKRIDGEKMYLDGKTVDLDIYMTREHGRTEFIFVCEEFDEQRQDRDIDVARKSMKAALDELLATTWERYLEVRFEFGSTATCTDKVSDGKMEISLYIEEVDFGTCGNGDKVHRDARNVDDEGAVTRWGDIVSGWPESQRGRTGCHWMSRYTDSQSRRVYLKATPETRAALNKIVFALTQAGELLLRLTDPDNVAEAFARIAAAPSFAMLGADSKDPQ